MLTMASTWWASSGCRTRSLGELAQQLDFTVEYQNMAKTSSKWSHFKDGRWGCKFSLEIAPLFNDFFDCRVMARYCFLEFNDAIVTKQILERLNNQPLPGTSGVRETTLLLTSLIQQLENVCVYFSDLYRPRGSN